MPKLFSNTSRFFAISVTVISSMGVLSATPANGLTFKATLSDSPFTVFGPQDIEYTLADGIFDTIVDSPINTFFSDQLPAVNADPSQPRTFATVIPEVVTDFKWAMGGSLEPLEFEQSIFGITDRGLFLQILDPSEGPYENILMATLQAPEGMPLSACKTQVCEGVATLGGAGGFAGLRMVQTPVVQEEPESVPEPSAAVALGLVSALLLKRHRKTGNAQPVAIAEQP